MVRRPPTPTPFPYTTLFRSADTRKTTPGLRAFERYAVRMGGGHNHRDSLGSAVMIKDNHIAAAGGIEPAVERARSRAPHTDRKSTRLNSSHVRISYAVFCLK